MLDRPFKLMLETAATLTADDLDHLRSAESVATGDATAEESATVVPDGEQTEEGAGSDGQPPGSVSSVTSTSHTPQAVGRGGAAASRLRVSAGEYERQRTRESKISTVCVGREREKHDWWPPGTAVIGRIGSETFTATVVENAAVKSNRSLLITSGPANGRVCMTPTRAAIEATESYRQIHSLGRGGGVTNGWEFWVPQT